MTDLSALIERRARGRLQTTDARRSSADAYVQRHKQLRREIRIAQAKEIGRTVAEFAAVAIFMGGVLALFGIINLPV